MSTLRFFLLATIQLLNTVAFAQTINVEGFVLPRLSPRPLSVETVKQSYQSLNGDWNVTVPAQGAKQSKIKVPGEWEMQGIKVNEGETAVYSRELNIPADWKGKRIKIRFDAVSSHAIVKVNGKKVGEHEGSFVPFEVDITEAVQNEKNILEVEVQSLTISDRLACTSQYAVHTVGGLLRKVSMYALPQMNIADITANTTFDAQFKDATLSVQATVSNESSVPASVSLRYTLKSADGKTVMQQTSANENVRPNAAASINTSLKVKQPKQWNPEQPNLYELQTELLQNGKMIETSVQKIGFRQVTLKGNLFLVNGKPIKLHGVNKHSVYPLTGRSVSPELDRKDAELFRAGNCNYIRTSHYPPSEEFLNAADELGLFVESESSLCWIQHGASPIWKLWNYLDEKYLPYMVRANMDNVLAGKKHPSVIIWSLGNESRWSPLWEKVNAVVKEMDPSRPTSFHDQCWGGFNNASSKADIANYHYPGINGPRATDTMSRPTLFGEYAHLSDYNRRELALDPGIRSAYGAPLVEFYDSVYAHKGNLGGAIWSGIDDIFHMPDGRIVGYGPWGPIDAWRRPKPEYYGMKKAYSPVKVTNVNWETWKEGYIELTVENRYDFVSLKDVKIKVIVNGGEQQLITSDIPAHGKGMIKVMKNSADNKSIQDVSVSFTDPRGFISENEIFHAPLIVEEGKPRVEKNVEYSENESAIFVSMGDVNFTISKSTGIITSVRKRETVLMTQGPVFCVAPSNDDDGGKPNVAGETYQNNIYPLKNYPLYTLFANDINIKKQDGDVLVSMNITYYDGSKGKQSYTFAGNGNLITDYEVMYTGQDSLPYQYGMLLQLPKTMDKLSWNRKGAFTVYPDNDIARNKGEAMLNAKTVKGGVEEWGVVPSGDWKDDANELGSNDFRATKHNITNASLSDRSSNKISVISNAKQSSRSWLQDESIQWLIADYWNNGSEPFYGSPHSNGRIKIKNKTLKGSLTLNFD